MTIRSWLVKNNTSVKLLKLMLIYSFVDAVASQMYINVFTSGFRIGLSVVSLPVYLYFFRKVNPVLQSIFIASVGLCARTFLTSLSVGSFAGAFAMEYQTAVFDISYGLFYYYYMYRKKDASDVIWYATILFGDFTCNTLELVFRYGEVNSLVLQATVTLLVIACIRASLALVIVAAIKYYRILLIKEEHNERYKNLLLLTSDLKGETYFMKKNMDYIEDVMNSAYILYEEMGSLSLPKEMKSLPLTIAKDVHEIKKDYIRVIRGLERIMSDEEDYEHMSLKDLMEILVSTTRKSLTEDMKNMEITMNLSCDMKVREHYLLMSVLRNLVVNAQEALLPGQAGSVALRVYVADDEVIFEVQDNGGGIREKHLRHIFDPGFSTKFSVTTGNISRGLGLTLVRDIVRERFDGDIDVESNPGQGTKFTVRIPKESLEEQL